MRGLRFPFIIITIQYIHWRVGLGDFQFRMNLSVIEDPAEVPVGVMIIGTPPET